MEKGSSSNSGMVSYRRDIEPAHYSFKIKSFSLLLKTMAKTIESDIFEAGGYKWRMVFYPNGNTKSNDGDYVSLYLAIKETNSMHQPWEVNAELKLFVFDHKARNYLTVQGIKRFHETEKEMGFEKFIPLETFNDGYLSDDSCVFGAEIFVIQPSGKYDCISMVKQHTYGIFTWEVENFSKLDQSQSSEAFIFGGREWKIKVYPKGDGNASNGNWLSVVLSLSDSATLPPPRKVYAEYRMRVLDQQGGQHVEKTGDCWYSASNYSGGCRRMIRLRDLHERSKGFVMNDTLIVEAQISVIYEMK